MDHLLLHPLIKQSPSITIGEFEFTILSKTVPDFNNIYKSNNIQKEIEKFVKIYNEKQLQYSQELQKYQLEYNKLQLKYQQLQEQLQIKYQLKYQQEQYQQEYTQLEEQFQLENTPLQQQYQLEYKQQQQKLQKQKTFIDSLHSKLHLVENRYKIYFRSRNILNDKSFFWFAYTSVSEMFCWRICFLVDKYTNQYAKFNNYRQATILNMSLQKFIWKNFQDLPFADESIASGKKSRSFTQEEKSTHFYQDVSSNPDINPFGIIECKVQSQLEVNIISLDRGTEIVSDIAELEDIYEIVYDGDRIDYSIYFTNKIEYHQYYSMENTMYKVKLKKKSSNIDDSKPSNIIAQVGDCKLMVKQTDGTTKTFSGKYILNLIPEMGENGESGETNINVYGLYNDYYYDKESSDEIKIPNIVTSKDQSISDKDKEPINILNITKKEVISKPIEYLSQLCYSCVEYIKQLDDFGDKYYYFIAHHNNDKFIIKQLMKALLKKRKLGETDIETDIETDNETDIKANLSDDNRIILKASKKFKPIPTSNNPFLKKYLKYKTKYIELKNKINPDIL